MSIRRGVPSSDPRTSDSRIQHPRAATQSRAGPFERDMIPSDEHVESAEAAGLRYVTDAAPGIRRQRRGRGFVYVGADGAVVQDRAELDRIRKLVIPPRWTEVWICPNPAGHLQVTARDARGRKQYRYHPKYRAVRDETKFGRMMAFSEILPLIRERVERDINLPELARDKVLATVVCPGQELFQYLDDDGRRQSVDAGDINEYLRRITGRQVTAKDFRTWAGTTLAAAALRDLGKFKSAKQAKAKIIAAIDQVSKRLGNTRAVCRKYYVHPVILELYLEGITIPPPPPVGTRQLRTTGGRAALRRDEMAVIELLGPRAKTEPLKAATEESGDGKTNASIEHDDAA
ncbi:MAG: DNA topoisomerase I [Gemmatimonadetes bacterium]|nr:MAG: DNA topoisomerase I [Gemmatimonadota bacterium]